MTNDDKDEKQFAKLIERLQNITATKQPKTQLDSIGQWVVTACIQDSTLRTPVRDLHASYAQWCESVKTYAMGVQAFSTELGHRGFPAIRNGHTRSRIGLAVKEDYKAPIVKTKEQPIFYGTTNEMLSIIIAMEKEESREK